MRTSLIVFGLALLPLLAGAQNARPVLADTNGVIRVGTVGSELTSLNASNLASGTAPTNVLPGALGTLSTWNGGGLLTNLAFPISVLYTNPGTVTTSTIPTGARKAHIRMVGVGGAGGSGARKPAGQISSGGSGGGGGAFTEKWVDLTTLWSQTLIITLPSLPLGGSGVTTDGGNGTNGASGSQASIYVGSTASDSNLVARVGQGSSGIGGDGDGSVGGTGGGSPATSSGAAGGASSTTGLIGAIGVASGLNLGAAGGGAGGGITTGDVPSAGGAGGFAGAHSFVGNAAAGGNPGLNGSSSSALWPDMSMMYTLGWPGAGGGGSQTNAAAGNGADGYGWGSGGGGGGASRDGYASGSGGKGGPAMVRITYY